MADYKVIDAEKLDADLTTVADAIRAKGGTTEPLEFPLGMKQAVEAISSSGDGGLPMWNGLISLISNNTQMNITHNLASDKLLIIAELVESTTRLANYQPYRFITWSHEVLTPHIKYAYGDYSNEAYADESVGINTNRTSVINLDSGGSSANALRIAAQNRNQNNLMTHSEDKNSFNLNINAYLGISTWNVTVIDISNAGISFSE